MNALPLLSAASLLVVAVSGAAVAAAADPSNDRITICHIPPGHPEQAKTMQVPRSAWSGHSDHGDHQGACTSADRRTPSSPDPAGLPKTRLAVSVHGEGDVDGDASFKAVVANRGTAPGVGVQVVATLRGDGEWLVRPSTGVLCSVQGQTVTCDYEDIPDRAEFPVRFVFDGDLSICREASVEVRMTADNDASAGDDKGRASSRVGACAPLDPTAAAAFA